MKKNQNGFSAVEGLLAVLVVAVIGFGGYYVWHTQKNNKAQTSSTISPNPNSSTVTSQKPTSSVKYLEIPEKGIKFQLTDKISDAYYVIDKGGYVRFSVHAFDTNPDLRGCTAKVDASGETALTQGGVAAQGIVTLIVAKPGDPNADEAGDPWTLQRIQQLNLKQVGDTYYGFMHGNGPCFDPSNQAARDEFNSVEPAFIAATPTITKL